uniref:LRRCT domain-containing protein n=1 Tax=Denticeps clupeoides TaxID=299321 RepID=A0AAY4DGC4_9TELE
MATRYLLLLCLWTAAVATVQCCPASCSCMDKYNHQLADCASKDLESVPVDLPANVTTLSLSANNIKVLKSKSFVNVTMITSLWLGHNAIVTVERDTLATLVNLRSLDISHNKIVHFPWEDLANLTALQLLKMNNNEMVHLPKDAFSNLKDLRSLRINNNKFTTIVQGTFDIPGLSHLQIYNNPFSCSCNLEWLRDWIAQAKISIPEQENTACDAPAHLQGLSVVKMPKLECKAPTVYEGFMLILNCEAKGSPRPEVKWEITAGKQTMQFLLPEFTEKNDSPINNASTVNRFLVFQNGTLIIPHMSKKVDGNSDPPANQFHRKIHPGGATNEHFHPNNELANLTLIRHFNIQLHGHHLLMSSLLHRWMKVDLRDFSRTFGHHSSKLAWYVACLVTPCTSIDYRMFM